MKTVQLQVTVVFNVNTPYPEPKDDPPTFQPGFRDEYPNVAKAKARDIVKRVLSAYVGSNPPRGETEETEGKITAAYITHTEIVEELD